MSAEDLEWIVPGEDWPLAGTYRGHAGLEEALENKQQLKGEKADGAEREYQEGFEPASCRSWFPPPDPEVYTESRE